ncbi:hypothetical protein [Caulobacter endophyticus]|uniref:hypothetical protein n=1 Tax=Caulobacter endophyticus TaxID=2172652 RepID=UPI00240F6234|nr:hypothetical protein [Caulobacter endophyticus]MDG2527609.1 hypothetical protein [Caulobacter endophyticus]
MSFFARKPAFLALAIILPLAGLAALILTGPPQRAACHPATVVRVDLSGQSYGVPVSIRPAFIAPDRKVQIRSNQHRAPDGYWAYCQDDAAPPFSIDSFVSSGNDLGPARQTDPDLGKVAALIVRAKGDPDQIIIPARAEPWNGSPVWLAGPPSGHVRQYLAPAGRLRPTPVSAQCSLSASLPAKCRIGFFTADGLAVSIDVVDEAPRPEAWPVYIAATERYLDGLKIPRS